MKTTMLEKMLPEPLTKGLFAVARCRAYVDALAMVLADVQERKGECTRAAYKAAKAKEWEKVLLHVAEGGKWQQAAKDAAYGADYMAGIAGKATSRIRKSARIRCAVFEMAVGSNLKYRPLPAAATILAQADAMAAECEAKAREIESNAEEPDGLGILEGMARVNLGRPIPKRLRNAKPMPQQRASGQRGARKAVRQ